MEDCLLLDAGSGGRASQRLVSQCFFRHFANPLLERMDDAALLTDIRGPLAMSTDSYTVTPLFFAGGSIGTLAVHGLKATYTAPAGADTHTITVTSVADDTQSASAVVTVTAHVPLW